MIPTVERRPEFGHVQAEQLQSNLRQLLDRQRAEVAAIVATDTPTRENLIEPMEAMSDAFNQFWSPVSHLNGVCNNESLRAAYNACLPEISAFFSELGQNEALQAAWQRLRDSDEYQRLDVSRQRAVDLRLRDFHLSGVDLPPAGKTRFREINSRLSQLSSRFSDQVLDATGAWTRHFDSAEALAGLPGSALAQAQDAARARELSGYLITLEFPSYLAVMTYADDRTLRREVYEAFCTRASDRGPHAGEFDNGPLMTEILALRQEQAQLLGFANYAEYSLAAKMAETPAQVIAFLEELAEKSQPIARQDLDALRAYAAESGVSELQAWDMAYFSEKLRERDYAVSQEALRPWFPVDRVLQGLFEIVGRLFGVYFEEDRDYQGYHPDARYFRLYREGELVAGLTMDLYARRHKRGGAWMADYCGRWLQPDGRVQLPEAFIVCNFAPPAGGTPALMTHQEVTTLFHECGHALHHMLTTEDCLDVSGISNVAWDAVELPSQFLENWCWEREALTLISGHYQSGEALPDALLDRMLAARHFQAGMAMVRQLEFALFDLRLHALDQAPDLDGIQRLLDDVRAQVAVFTPPEFNRFQHSFTHVFAGGYAAGYYSYKWAEVLSADAFSAFEEAGIFDRQTGERFLQHILSRGGSADAAVLFEAFRGRAPKVDALLRHNGIKVAA